MVWILLNYYIIPAREVCMSDYDVLYLIDTSYNGERDATEVTFGYIEKEEDVKGRIRTVRVIVNVPGHKDDERGAVKEGIAKAREILARSASANFEKD